MYDGGGGSVLSNGKGCGIGGYTASGTEILVG